MAKQNIAKIVKSLRIGISKHSPEILTGIGIAGMVATTVMAVKATPKALTLIEAERDRREEAVNDGIDPMTKTEIVKTAWKCYIPATVTGVMSIACLIGASSVNAKRNAALVAAYTLSDSALKEYRDKVVETIGEKKEHVIRDKVAEDRVKSNPVGANEIIVTKNGNTKCYDILSGRYFTSDMNKIKDAEIEINRLIITDMYASLNEFYDQIGLSNIPLGDQLGWKIDDGKLEIYFSSVLDAEGEPCLSIDYNVAPKYGFSSLM